MYQGLILKQAAWPSAVADWLGKQDPSVRAGLGGAVLGGAISLPGAVLDAAAPPRKKEESRFGNALKTLLAGAGAGGLAGAGMSEGYRLLSGDTNPLLRALPRQQQFQAINALTTHQVPWELPGTMLRDLNTRMGR